MTVYTHSYDMLGEAALTSKDAERYKQAYVNSIQRVGRESFNNPNVPRPDYFN